MKGILFKDFLSAKRILTIYLLMIICFSFGGAKGVFFALCYSIMVPVNQLGFDERSRFDRYASVLPLTGLQCVADKYIVMYLSMAVMMVLSSLIVFLRTGAASAMEDMLLYAATVLATHALCMPLLNPVTGRLFDRFGGKLVGIVGFSLLIAGTASFVFFSDSTPVALVAALYLVRMVGVAFILMPMTAYCMTDLGGDDLPQGTAIVNSLRQICGSLGSSVMVAVVAHASAGAAVVAGAGVSMHGFSVSFGLQAVLLGVSLVGTIAFVHGKRHGKAAKGAAAA